MSSNKEGFTKTEIRDLISAYLQPFGQGFKYYCRVNGNSIPYGELRDEVENGDEVVIEVVKGHQGWSERCFDIVSFDIEKNTQNLEKLERYRNKKNRVSVFLRDTDDYQKQKLYRWENRAVENYSSDKVEKTEKAAQNFINPIFNQFGFEPSTVKYHAGRSATCSYHSYEDEIRIGDWGYNKGTLIHESAHSIVQKLGVSNFVSDHGPFFVSVFMKLLADYFDESLNELKDEADYYNLDYIDDLDINWWVDYRNNDGEIDLEFLNYLRQENYILKDGTKLNENQMEEFKKIKNDKNGVDGRSARALINKNLVKENGEGYVLTERGEEALV